MSRKIVTFCLLLSFASISAFADNKSGKKSYQSTRQVMNEVFQSFVNLIPYVSDEMKFRDPNSEEYIIGNLTRISQAFKNAKHIKTLNSGGFRPSYDVVQDHLDQTIEAFHSRNKIFARTRLKATAQICMSCHSQLGSRRSSGSFRSLNNIARNDFQNDFDYADFLYLIRDYNKAVRYYEKEITNRITKNKELKKIHQNSQARYIDFTIENSFKRVITIFTKIHYSPAKAVAFLDKFRENKELSPKLKEDISDWIADLNIWAENKQFKGKVSNHAQLKSFIKTHLKPSESGSIGDGSYDITLLMASGVLYRYLNSHTKSTDTPEILYWLAKVNRQFEHSYFYSLADIYLKQCITRFPASDFAKKCYSEYEDNITFGFTGSAGVNIPKEERQELKRLKALLK